VHRTQRDALAAFGVRLVSAALLYLSQIVLARWMGSYE
jgi:O-antigen/teichoic acid export membrane protein